MPWLSLWDSAVAELSRPLGFGDVLLSAGQMNNLIQKDSCPRFKLSEAHEIHSSPEKAFPCEWALYRQTAVAKSMCKGAWPRVWKRFF